jgi:hypothetical protein
MRAEKTEMLSQINALRRLRYVMPTKSRDGSERGQIARFYAD